MRGLKQPMLNAESIWNLETDSKKELDNKFQEGISEDDSSDHSALKNLKKKATKRKNISPIKITPDKLMITLGDKTTTITNTKDKSHEKQ